MDELAVDLRDRRGRLSRLIAATVIGLAVTIGLMTKIMASSADPNSDPVAQGSVVLLAIGMFVVVTSCALGVITKVTRNLRKRH